MSLQCLLWQVSVLCTRVLVACVRAACTFLRDWHVLHCLCLNTWRVAKSVLRNISVRFVKVLTNYTSVKSFCFKFNFICLSNHLSSATRDVVIICCYEIYYLFLHFRACPLMFSYVSFYCFHPLVIPYVITSYSFHQGTLFNSSK